MHLNARLRTLYALSSVVLAGMAFGHSLNAATGRGAMPVMPPVAPAVAAIVAASPREKALATLKAITPGAIQRRFDQELRWQHESLLKAYEDVGSHDPKWDDIVRQALTLAARVFAQDPTRPGDASEQMRELFGQAVAAGCDDPLIGFFNARYADTFRREGEAAADLVRAATKLEQSKYPVFRRAQGLAAAADGLAEAARKTVLPSAAQDFVERGKLLDRATTLLPEVLKDATITDRQIRLITTNIVKGRQRLGGDRLQAYEALAPTLAAQLPEDRAAAVQAVIKADVLNDAAWDIRGTGYAETVSDEKFRRFEALVARAEASLVEGIDKGSSDPNVGSDMMELMIGVNSDNSANADREMLDWFEIARKLDPGGLEPYDRRLASLLPRWGGTDESALAFARAAFARKEWGSRAPLILIAAHDWVHRGPPAKLGYFERKEVCAEVKNVYETFLAQHPNANSDRSRYVRRLVECKAWREADAQLKRLDNRVVLSVFDGQYEVERKLIDTFLRASRN
jgi:hypothetical protein